VCGFKRAPGLRQEQKPLRRGKIILALLSRAVGRCAAMATNVNAHITGTVWKIEVKEGETVSEGQTCVILESMKMEMPVEAPSSGKVEKISCAEGQAVNEGDVLLTIA
jgi:acetyl-CoA carboxylase biotin carboxyl carrier protein